MCLNFETKKKRKIIEEKWSTTKKKRKIQNFFFIIVCFVASSVCKSSGGRGTREHGEKREKERDRQREREFRCEWWFLTLSFFHSEKQRVETKEKNTREILITLDVGEAPGREKRRGSQHHFRERKRYDEYSRKQSKRYKRPA